MHRFTLFYKYFLKTWHSAITTPSQCPPTWNSWWNIPQRSFHKCRSVEPTGFVLLQSFLLRPSSSVILVSLVLNLLWEKKNVISRLFFPSAVFHGGPPPEAVLVGPHPALLSAPLLPGCPGALGLWAPPSHLVALCLECPFSFWPI